MTSVCRKNALLFSCKGGNIMKIKLFRKIRERKEDKKFFEQMRNFRRIDRRDKVFSVDDKQYKTTELRRYFVNIKGLREKAPLK